MEEKLHKVIKNINIVNHDKIVFGDIHIEDGIISKINVIKQNEQKGYEYCIPGFIDQHTHGGYGISFDSKLLNASKADIDKYFTTKLKDEGVCGVFATSVTTSVEELEKIGKKLSSLKYDQLLGWHIEGPFIASSKKGAHDENLIKPACDEDMEIIIKSFKGNIIITIAPEINDNMKIIKEWSKMENISFSVGHSNANYSITKKAFDNGAKQLTHMYNAMSGFSHRNPGIINYEFDGCKYAELITDGIHVDNKIIKTTYSIIGANNIIVVSDSLYCKGLKDKKYELGTLPIYKIKNYCYLKDKKTLAGSAMLYIDILKNFKKQTKCSLQDIVKVSSYNSCINLNIKNLGQIKEGYLGKILVIDKDLNIKKNFC